VEYNIGMGRIVQTLRFYVRRFLVAGGWDYPAGNVPEGTCGEQGDFSLFDLEMEELYGT